jgi:hypothetical protein
MRGGGGCAWQAARLGAMQGIGSENLDECRA